MIKIIVQMVGDCVWENSDPALISFGNLVVECVHDPNDEFTTTADLQASNPKLQGLTSIWPGLSDLEGFLGVRAAHMLHLLLETLTMI
eukprot:7357650-Alexandrium_andersonii.AAC.1